ncbi:MAG: endonuclease VII [Oscillospiraceae bacterium]|nr:endonuclease VII [Oscillospiraceae bacterium]
MFKELAASALEKGAEKLESKLESKPDAKENSFQKIGSILERRKPEMPRLCETTEKKQGLKIKNVLESMKPELPKLREQTTEMQDTMKLSPVEKFQVKMETGWSNKIVDSIRSMKEYEVYKTAGLKEANIGGKECLIKTDIEWNQTNRERVAMGRAPLDKNGKPIELHHIGQNPDSPLAELTESEHGGKNDAVLHDKSIESRIDRNKFGVERARHWKARAADLKGDV